MTTAPPRKKRSWFWPVFTIGLIIFVGLWYGSSQNPAPPVQSLDAVPVPPAAQDTAQRVVDRLG